MSRKRLEKRKKDHSTFIEILWSFIIIMSSGKNGYYIMPPMPPIPGAPIGISGLSSFFSTITHSVVRNIPAIEAAFSKATRATFAGSTTPAACNFHIYQYEHCNRSHLYLHVLSVQLQHLLYLHWQRSGATVLQ